jgi:hypothetical protein
MEHKGKSILGSESLRSLRSLRLTVCGNCDWKSQPHWEALTNDDFGFLIWKREKIRTAESAGSAKKIWIPGLCDLCVRGDWDDADGAREASSSA